MVANLSFNQTMVKGIADQFGSGREFKFFQEPGAIGADGLDAERQGLGDVPDGLAPGLISQGLRVLAQTRCDDRGA